MRRRRPARRPAKDASSGTGESTSPALCASGRRILLDAWRDCIEDALKDPVDAQASVGFEAWLKAGGSGNVKSARRAALRAMRRLPA